MNKKKGFLAIEYIIVAAIVIVFTMAIYVVLGKDQGEYNNSVIDKIEDRESFIGQHILSYHPSSSTGVDISDWQENGNNAGLITEHINVSSIDFEDGDQYEILVGDVIYIEASVSPEDASKKELVWKVNSGGDYIIPAKIDSSTIQITGATPGKAVIEAQATDGSGTKKYAYITAKQPVNSITVEASKTILSATSNEIAYVQATIKPSDATEQRVNWSFGNGGIGSECLKIETGDDSRIATITAIRSCKGQKTKIVATTLDGGYTAEIEFTITE